MANQFDLRGFNIKTDKDALDFIELLESKLPQLHRYIKRSNIRTQSLIDRASHAEGQLSADRATVDEQQNLSVGDRLSGERLATKEGEEEREATESDRLAQMKAAQSDSDADKVPAAGEIGSLDQSEGTDQDSKSGDDAGTSTPDTGTETATDEAGDQQESAAKLSADDVTPVGERVATKTQGTRTNRTSKPR